MKKQYLVMAALSTYFVTTPAQALPCDSRGSNWNGSMRVGGAFYNFELRRQSCAPGSLWNFYVRPTSGGGAPSQGQVTVVLNGRAISVSPVAGTASGCPFSLSGTYAARDVTNGRPYRGSGTASCGGTGTWRATIR